MHALIYMLCVELVKQNQKSPDNIPGDFSINRLLILLSILWERQRSSTK